MQIATNESTVLQINHITTLKGMGKNKRAVYDNFGK